jgi:16S rRNA (uracil1498-N3)-methyltransferase
MDKKSIYLRGRSRVFPSDREAKKQITLYQALPNKHEKIEWIIQKSVEVGIQKIVFFRSERSQKLVITDAKKERYQHIMQEALEQCGGLVPMEIVW